jgi:hypothetical protein
VTEWLLSIDLRLVPVAQLAASTLLAVASLVVALVALHFAYRNNFGWKPLLLLKSHGGSAGSNWSEISCTFEIWNRRKYPVVIREMQVLFGAAKIDFDTPNVEGEETDWWSTESGGLLHLKTISLQPSQHLEFEAAGPVRRGDGNPIDAEVWADLYDPRLNASVVLRAGGRRRPRWWIRTKRRRLPGFSTSQRVRRRRGAIESSSSTW